MPRACGNADTYSCERHARTRRRLHDVPMAKLTPRFEEFLALGPHGFGRIGYTEWGPRDAPRTAICVHGLTRNSRDRKSVV